MTAGAAGDGAPVQVPDGAVLTALYVPGDRPDRFEKAARSGADVVFLDLEDAVAPSAKQAAREAVTRWLAGPRTPVTVQVRVNGLGTRDAAADLGALSTLAAWPQLRLPKVASVDDLERWADVAGPGAVLHPLVESAAGVEAAHAIARHPAVASLGLGEVDLAADLGTSGEAALAWVRSRVVVAARAAGLPPPLMSVYPHLVDLDGLAASCRAGRALGFRGRAAVHPRQLPVVVTAFRPSSAEVARARDHLAVAGAGGVGVSSTGAMVDAAMTGPARRVLAEEAAAARAMAVLARRT